MAPVDTVTLASLAGIISARTVEVSRLVAAKGLQDPGFGEKSFNGFVGEDVELRQARNELAGAAQDLARLAQGPEDNILQLAWSSADTANLAVILRFNISQHVPLDSTISTKDLASAVGLPEDIVVRSVRYAIGNGMFCEPETGKFAHSASSALLAQNEHLRDIAVTGTRELSYILLRLADALKMQHQNGREFPQAAFNLAYPEYHNIFEFLGKDPESAQRYHKYMVGRAHTSRWTIGHIITAYDWAAIGSKTILDAGGSSGHTCLALAPACPDAKFIVQDVDPVALDQGKNAMAVHHPELEQRIVFQVHDFFQPQPVSADVYIFRHIFHDWSDADTVRILKNLVPALRNGAKVLVSEGVVPSEPATTANTLDKKQILVEDMFMLSVHGGKERTIEDFVSLFEQADVKFKYVGTTGGINGAFQSLLEFSFQDESVMQ
ncbi:hypothetical protein MMC11_007102 [Xylographa trunciseda]|nr:hypothetical protein [Xylographa trunciseda]